MVETAAQRRILILGANGFIGSHVVDCFAKEAGLQIRAFDRFSHEPKFKNLGNVEIFKGNIFEEADLQRALEDVDYVMHCFSATTPFVSDNNPYIDVTDNLLRSIKLFDLCVSTGIKKVGFISSGGAVYGSLAEQKVAHETDPPLPVSPYGINKLSIEHYLEYYKRKFGTNYIVYRVSNPYGPRQVTKNNQGVVPTFIQKIRDHEEIIIYGDGSASRDYIYIEDVATMIVNSFLKVNKCPVYNVGSGKQTSLNDIINELSSLYDYEPKIVYKEAPKTFLSHTSISIERYCNEFGRPQFIPLNQGLAATIAAAK